MRRRPRSRFVIETTTPYRKTVAPLFFRSDVAVIRTSTEISHEAIAVVCGRGLLKVPKRCVAASAEVVRERCALAA